MINLSCHILDLITMTLYKNVCFWSFYGLYLLFLKEPEFAKNLSHWLFDYLNFEQQKHIKTLSHATSFIKVDYNHIIISFLQAPVHPAASPNTPPILGGGPAYAMTQLSPSAHSYPLTVSQTDHVFPQRPGETECQFYMKTGDCKFGSSCRYRHPPELTLPNTNIVLSPMGLPLRPVSNPSSLRLYSQI